jgi:hypothetical protein
MSDARDTEYIEALRGQLRADGDAAGKDRLALELMEEALPYIRGAGHPPPSLTARLFRFYTDTGDLELAERHRAHLHRFASRGDELAAAVLALLSDDPFWRQT